MTRIIHQRDRRRVAALIGIAALTVAATACGSDDDTETAGTAETVTGASVTTPASTGATVTSAPMDTSDSVPRPSVAPEYAEFCAVATELFEQESLPTMEQFDEYAALAPDELDEPLGIVADALEEAGGDFTALFGDDDVEAAFGELEAVESEQCGLEAPDDGPPQDPSVTVLDPEATRVDVEATEYEFDADHPTDAGRYSFVMTNAGEESHIMIIAHLEDEAVLDQVLEAEGEEGIIEVFESEVAAPGEEAVVTADLVSGRWVMLCPIPTPEGEPHFALGMLHEFDIS